MSDDYGYADDRARQAGFHPDGRCELCPDCGHAHTGPEFGSICIGCPCENYPSFHGEIVT